MIKSHLSEEEQIINRKIEYWTSRLLDFSRRNRLLYFKTTKSSTAEIIHPAPTDLFDRLVVKGKILTFPLSDDESTSDIQPEQESTQATKALSPLEIGVRQSSKQINRILYNLRTRSRIAREEQGVNILFLTFGFLNWRDSLQGEMVQAPLVLVPVELRREAPGQPYQMAMLEEDIVVNPTLQEWLHQSFRLELPELPEDIDADGLIHYWQLVNTMIRTQTNWSVEPKIVLSIFSYQKQMLVADLEQNRKKLIEHTLIRSMSIPGLPIPSSDIDLIRAEELDDRVLPETTFQVLDADSTQQEAIQAAKSGLSFVLQGPPGTGKSQTIANIIAEFLGEGKRVLFVSAKMAALEVVQERLNKVGLGDFCLQIHSFRRDKREIVEELGKSINTRQVPRPTQLQEKIGTLKVLRKNLNDYVRALHKPRHKLGVSAFKAYGELAHLVNAPKVRFNLNNIETLTPETHQLQIEFISKLANFPQVIDRYNNHSWLGCQITELSLQLQNDIESSLIKLVEEINEFAAGVRVLSENYGVENPRNLFEGWEIVRVAHVYKPIILNIPIANLCQRYEKSYQSILRYLRPQYWKDSNLLRDLSHRQGRPNPEKVLQDLDFAKRVQQRRISEHVESLYQENQLQSSVSRLIGLGRQIKGNLDFIRKQFYSDQLPKELTEFFNIPFEVVVAWCQQHSEEISSLIDWAKFNRLCIQAYELDLAPFISQAFNVSIKAANWPAAFLRQFYSLLIDSVVWSDEALLNFQGQSHQVLINQFRLLDREQILLTQQLIRARILERRPQADWMISASSEEAILRRELNKKRRLKPLRRLFGEVPELILSLRPCLMMSPLTVSQLLNPELFYFDLVVFDEASQIHPEEAVGAIIRAKQVIIVGDRHQLPPTSFFEILEGDEDYNEDINQPEDFESILNESDASGLPNKMLLWHYRSRDESLIAFSNYHFYQNRLLTFPAAVRNPQQTGVEFINVPNGVYRRISRNNEIEAKRVIGLILEHFQEYPEQSLGVVTFSQAQRDIIQIELDRIMKDNPTLWPYFSDAVDEPFFVKNLELVQGDERDVMIFSVGYGKDETGRLLLNFGPLNREGGERRLNVAVTRARHRVKMVTSIQPEDIDLSRTESRGVKLLRSYMTLARDGLKTLYADISVDLDADFESPFEAAVYEALIARGLRLQKQVGVSFYRIDMAVLDPEQLGRFLLGIECDGAMYHSAPTARDRDRLRQQVLESLGWRIHRIWSRDWIENQDREIKKVVEAVKESWKQGRMIPGSSNPGSTIINHQIETRISKSPGASPHLSTIDPKIFDTSQRTLPPEVVLYSITNLKVPYKGVESFRFTNIHQLEEMLKIVVESEGPIASNVAKRRITDAFAIRRVGNRINQTLDWAIFSAIRRGLFRQIGIFLWPSSEKPLVVRVPHKGDGLRSIEEIPPEELMEGMYLCVRSALSLDKEDLVKQTAKLFGLRVNAKVTLCIERGLSKLVQSQRLEWRGEKIRLPQK